MEIDLIDFLKNGYFGSLKLEDSKDTVLNLIGEPEDVSADTITDLIWKYGNVEITFGVDGVACVFIENGNTDTSSLVNISDYVNMRNISITNLKEKLAENKIEILKENYIDKDKTEGLLFLDNKVKISFENNIVTSYSICDPQKFIV